MKSWMSNGVNDRDYERLQEGAVAVKPTAHAKGEILREQSKREWLRKWGLMQERAGPCATESWPKKKGTAERGMDLVSKLELARRQDTWRMG